MWLTWALCAACAILLWPLAPAVMLAIWLAGFARVIQRPLAHRLGGRVRLASALSVVALLLVLVPFVSVFVSLAADAYELAIELLQSPRGKEFLERLATHGGSPRADATQLWDFVLSQQERAWEIFQQVAGTATRVVIQAFVVIAGTYAVLVNGSRWYAWIEQHAPISPAVLARLRDAFFETGRGLFIGMGGSALLQGAVSTIVYSSLGISHALELGLLTFVASFIPAIGSGLVWGPLVVGLVLTGHTGAAVILACFGVAVIGTVDNLARPWLARRGKLQLPTYIVLVAMFAGVFVLGPWGLLVAPLAVRLAKAALEAEP